MFGVALLFVMISFSSMSSAESVVATNASDVQITLYQQDGTMSVTQLSLDEQKIQTLRDLALSGSVDNLLQCLLEYGLIDASMLEIESVQNDEILQENDLGLLKLDKIKAGLPFIISPMSKVSSITVLGGSKRIGITPVLRIIEKLLPINLKRAELLATSTGLFGVVSTQNMLCNKALAGMFVGVIYVGFVGISIKIPGVMHIFSGYSSLTISSGLGIKIRNVKNIGDSLGA